MKIPTLASLVKWSIPFITSECKSMDDVILFKYKNLV